MIRRSLICLITLGLVACATQPKAPPSPPQATTLPQPPPSALNQTGS